MIIIYVDSLIDNLNQKQMGSRDQDGNGHLCRQL